MAGAQEAENHGDNLGLVYLLLVHYSLILLSRSKFVPDLNYSLSGKVFTQTEVKFLSDWMTSCEVCFAWFSLFLFVNVASFLFPSGILLLIYYKPFSAPFFFTFSYIYFFISSVFF